MRLLLLPALLALSTYLAPAYLAPAAAAQPPALQPPAASPGESCASAIQAAQTRAKLPKGLLPAIGMVESGRPNPRTGAVQPWPWTIDAEGQPAFFATKEDAIAAVAALQARGVASIDVGCMQINLMHHPQAFDSLDEAFDPASNATYAARFLTRLYGQTHDWAAAAALYHSATPDLAEAYQRRVLIAWGVPLPLPTPPVPPLAGSVVLSAAIPPGRVAVLLPPSPGQDIRVVSLDRGGRKLPVP